MKKRFYLPLILLFVAISVFGQNRLRREYKLSDVDQYFPRNELRVNLLYGVLGFPEIDYEYFLEDNFGLGIAGAFSMYSANDNYLTGALLPYGRLYFGHRPASGFFIEGNTGVFFSANRYVYDSGYYNTYTKASTGAYFGLGVAVGFKFLTRNNWVGEISLGVGRTFGDNIDAYPRCGISIGKRF